jgi:hypothetical protein
VKLRLTTLSFGRMMVAPKLPAEVTITDYLGILNRNHELELHQQSKNPWMRWVHFAHMLDSFRFFPRIFIGAYIALLIYSSIWFMALAVPIASQSAFVGTVIGAGAAWFGLYVNSGWKHRKVRE